MLPFYPSFDHEPYKRPDEEVFIACVAPAYRHDVYGGQNLLLGGIEPKIVQEFGAKATHFLVENVV